jgi:hypothetical protein
VFFVDRLLPSATDTIVQLLSDSVRILRIVDHKIVQVGEAIKGTLVISIAIPSSVVRTIVSSRAIRIGCFCGPRRRVMGQAVPAGNDCWLAT